MMSWLEIFGLFIAIITTTSLFYKSGVKAGIKHALITLNLDQHQAEKLNKELKSQKINLHK